jgi:hypothetical protein
VVLVLKANEKNQPELIGYSTAEIIAHAVPTEPKSFGRQPSAEPSRPVRFRKIDPLLLSSSIRGGFPASRSTIC